MSDRIFELLKIVIDKFILAAILVFIGLLAKQTLEVYKFDLAFENEIRANRADKIGEVWQELYRFEELTDKFSRSVIDTRNAAMSNDDLSTEDEKRNWIVTQLKETSEQYQEMHANLQEIAYSNKFWLGDEHFTKCADYTNALGNYYGAVLKGNQTALDNAIAERKKLRIDINSIRDDLLHR